MPDAVTLAEWAAASQALLFVTKSPGDTLEAGKVNLLDTSGGPGTFTLPDPSMTRDPVVAKRTGASDATLDVFGGGTIDGALTNILVVDQEACTYTALDPDYRATAGLGTPSPPLAHAPSHESGGSDEMSVAGLAGLLADPQTPTAHAATHESGGSDALDVTTLGGFPGGTTDFLRADGAFAAPPGGGGGGDNTLMWGSESVGTSTTTRYLDPGYSDHLARVDIDAGPRWQAPRAGTLKNMYVNIGGVSSDADPIVYTVLVNGVAVGGTLTVSIPGTSGGDSDLVNTVAVAAGDFVDVRATKASSVSPDIDEVVVTMEFAAP